jgi:hypothetical protein
MLLAPVVRSRKGHYHELFVQMAKKDTDRQELTVNSGY